MCWDFQVIPSLCGKPCKDIGLLNLLLRGGTGLAADGKGELLRVSSSSCSSFPRGRMQEHPSTLRIAKAYF